MTLAAKYPNYRMQAGSKASQGDGETTPPSPELVEACCRTPDGSKDPGLDPNFQLVSPVRLVGAPVSVRRATCNVTTPKEKIPLPMLAMRKAHSERHMGGPTPTEPVLTFRAALRLPCHRD